MNARQYRQRVGRKPVMDDLERCNCKLAGTMGHSQCGINRHGMPNFYAPHHRPRKRLRCLQARPVRWRPSPNTRRRWKINFLITRSEARTA